MSSRKRTRVRVWWPPTDDAERSGYSGMYWPANILREDGQKLLVSYDNGDSEWVNSEDLQPTNAPVVHGKEKKPLQRGEFVEVHNASDTDPAEWVGLIKKIGKSQHLVTYPFHDAKDEQVKETLIRRARVFDAKMRKWLYIEPYQNWMDGQVTSPMELRVCQEKELFEMLTSLNGPGN